MVGSEGEQTRAVTIARCHEIQVALGPTEVPEFETIPLLGMATRLALHIRGLRVVDYQVLRLVATSFLGIPSLAVERIVRLLADIEFVRIQQQGGTIKKVLATVPYYDELYDRIGDYAEAEVAFNEPEELALELVSRLARAPESIDALRNKLGADNQLFQRGVKVGTDGSYLIKRRARGRDVLVNPTYFSENADVFADAVAGSGASSVAQLIQAVARSQGYPLSLIEQQGGVGGSPLAPDQVRLLKRLAQDGIVKPPSIVTEHAGEQFFVFTPTPSGGALSPTKRDIYERAMAIVAAVRQGQFLAKRYAIRSPEAVLYRLKSDLRLGKATTEATQQYNQLVHLRIGRLEKEGDGFARFEIIDTKENREALAIAYSLVVSEEVTGMEVDEDARAALQGDQQYVESLIAATELRKRETIALTPEQREQLDLLLLGDEP